MLSRHCSNPSNATIACTVSASYTQHIAWLWTEDDSCVQFLFFCHQESVITHFFLSSIQKSKKSSFYSFCYYCTKDSQGSRYCIPFPHKRHANAAVTGRRKNPLCLYGLKSNGALAFYNRFVAPYTVKKCWAHLNTHTRRRSWSPKRQSNSSRWKRERRKKLAFYWDALFRFPCELAILNAPSTGN